MGSYQEGSVESVGGGPVGGRHAEDRTGQGGRPPDVTGDTEHQTARDVFTSSEVAEQSADDPGRPSRTRS